MSREIVINLDTFLKIYHPYLSNQLEEAYSLLFTRAQKMKVLITITPKFEKY